MGKESLQSGGKGGPFGEVGKAEDHCLEGWSVLSSLMASLARELNIPVPADAQAASSSVPSSELR